MPSPARTHHRRRSSGTSGKHKEESDVRLLDVCDIPRSTLIDWANLKDSTTRRKEIKKLEMTQYTSEDVTRIEPMSFIEEASCMFLFLFGVPGAVFSLPVLFVILYYLLPTKIVIAVAAIPLYLAVSPVKFNERSLISWQAVQISKYFSFKVAFDYVFPADQPFILVAPPHGVFPFGSIITMLAFPSIMGFPFHGLAASAAFSTPVYRQLLTTIGVIDARCVRLKINPSPSPAQSSDCSRDWCPLFSFCSVCIHFIFPLSPTASLSPCRPLSRVLCPTTNHNEYTVGAVRKTL